MMKKLLTKIAKCVSEAVNKVVESVAEALSRLTKISGATGMKGSTDIIQAIFILFLVALFSGLFVYSLSQLKVGLNDTQATNIIDRIISVFGTVSNLLGPYGIMIVVGAIASVAVALYLYFRGATGG